MADNKSQAQHLASLDFDISQLIETLRQVDEQTKAYGLQAGKNFYTEFQKGANETKTSSSTTTPKFVDEDSIESEIQQVSKLDAEYGKLAKTVERYNAKGNLTSGKNTFIDDAGIETVVRYNKKMEEVGKTITANYAKAEKAAESQLKKEQALRDNFYKKNMTQIDAEISERERQSQVFSAQIKEQMTLRVKEETEAKKVVSQIERMIEKQKQFNALVSQQRTSSTNKDILNQSNQYIDGLEQLKTQIESTGKVTEEQKSQISDYGNSIKQLSGYYQEAGTKGESFLQKISDKAKWLGAFYVVNELRQGFVQAISTIKETEDAVVSLQRVLNDDTISQSRISDELYDIAIEYGRTFDEVSEVTQQFVQAGNNWTDSVELTRGTMLALNTAELDVTQSTEGLIAIMAQWNLEAEDYADVIDKINITADDFAVTSEKIVAALQRSSSSAKNANISLEETIGIITALAEATGRSGEHIGTALNSLIVYTSKSSALETFAEVGSDTMKKVVSDYQRGAVSIYDVWKQLSKEIQRLTQEQQEALFDTSDFQDLAEELQTSIGEIYGAAGTYRQNPFIALLNDIETAEEAVKGMADAEGYSLQENEKYMESLTASWNQLKSVLAELAVQAGEAGLLDFLKILTSAGITVAELTKSLGGVIPVLTTIGGIIITIKAQKISKSISDFVSGISSGITSAKNFSAALISVKNSSNKLAAANALLQSSFSWIGIATAGIGILVSVFSLFNSAAEKLKQNAIESANANLEEAKSIESLKSEYTEIVNYTGDAAEKTEKLSEFKKKLIEQYGLETDAVNELNGARASEIDFLDQEYQKKIRNAYADIQNIYKQQVKQMESPYTPVAVESTDYDTAVVISEMMKAGTLEEQRDVLAEILTDNELNSAALAFAQEQYDQILEKLSDIGESYQTNSEIAAQFFLIQDETLDLIDKINNASSDSEKKKYYDELIESIDDQNYGLEAQEIILQEINDLFPDLSGNAEKAGETVANSFSISNEEIEKFRENIDSLNESIDGFQSGFDTVISAIEEYNEHGYLTVDTIQALISAGGDYVSMLDITADGIYLNEEATNRLMQSQKENIDAMLQQAMTADVLETVQRYLAGTTEDVEASTTDAGNAAQTAAGQIAELATQAMNGTISMAQFNAAIRNELPDVSDYQGLQSELGDIINRYKNLSSVIGDLSVNQGAWSNQAATAASNAAKEQTEAIKKQLEAQKEAVKDRYDAEIQALKDVQEENDRLQKQEEYYRNRQEALNDIEKAATRSGVEYREQESEARQKLEELDREWQETVADWSIEDKIAELEALRDAEVAAIDAQIDALEGSVSSIGTSMVKSYSNANKSMLSNYKTEYLEPLEQDTEETYSTTFEELPDVFGDALSSMLEQAKLNSMQLNNIYSVNFISPMSESLQKLQQQMIALQIATPNLPYLPYLNGAGYFSNQNVVNNNTQNANVYANVFTQSAANSLLSGVFKKP